ncbi:MAG: NAD(P)/FAD-dependent oxidoreductase [Thermoplasmata archaeon]
MKVVIAGGGFCGSMVAKRLDKNPEIDVTLIDEKKYFEYYPSLPKLITDPDYHDKIIKPYSQFLENTDIIVERIEKMSPKYVLTKNRKVEFDVLVVSLGAEYPIYLENKKDVFIVRSGKEVKELSKKIGKSERILIVGGGLIGTEVAAGLVAKTNKEIKLVHSHSELVERNPKVVSYFAKIFLEEKGVELRLNEKVVRHEENVFYTNIGNNIEAEVCIWSTGLSYDKDLYHNFDEISFAENGSLCVNESLQVRGYSNIFAGGDITDIAEQKTGHNADSHARIISKNMVRMKEGKVLKTYSRMKTPLVISLGDVNGIISFPPIGMPGPIPAFVKYLLEKGALFRL